MKHTRGAPYHPQTQGKIERWHQTLKNRILLQNYFLPGDLEAQIDAFVAHYNHQRYHESLKNLTPADVYTGRGPTILLEREKIKRRTMKLRCLQHAKTAAQLKLRCARPSLSQAAICLKIPDDGHNARIEDVLQSHHFRSGEELETTLHRCGWLYNQQLPPSALASQTPLQAMKDWHEIRPELFKKQPYSRPGCDS
jgi:hypothetical protein